MLFGCRSGDGGDKTHSQLVSLKLQPNMQLGAVASMATESAPSSQPFRGKNCTNLFCGEKRYMDQSSRNSHQSGL